MSDAMWNGLVNALRDPGVSDAVKVCLAQRMPARNVALRVGMIPELVRAWSTLRLIPSAELSGLKSPAITPPSAVTMSPAPSRRATVKRKYGDENADWSIHFPKPDPTAQAEARRRRRLARDGGDSTRTTTTTTTTSDEFIDWSDEVERALGDPGGLAAVWIEAVLPHLGDRVADECKANHRLRELATQYRAAIDAEGLTLSTADAHVLRTIEEGDGLKVVYDHARGASP